MTIKITPELVVESIKATGIKPIFNDFGDYETCGCALTAIGLYKFPEEVKKFKEYSEKTEFRLFADLFSLPSHWTRDFAAGFDNTGCIVGRDRDIYELGQQCREAVRREFPE